MKPWADAYSDGQHVIISDENGFEKIPFACWLWCSSRYPLLTSVMVNDPTLDSLRDFEVGDKVIYADYPDAVYTIEWDYGCGVYFIGNADSFVDLVTANSLTRA